MKRNDIVIALVMATIIGALLYVWLSPEGKNAPALVLETTTGAKITLPDPHKQPVLVSFWATTCSTCLKEMPHLIELYRELHPRGLEVIGVSMYYDPPIQVVEMIKRRNIPYPVVMDLDRKILTAFGMQTPLTPTTFLISPDGRIVLQKSGIIDMQHLRRDIENMLNS